MIKRSFLLVLIGISFSAAAQTNRYFVFFKDKNNSPYSISDPIKFLTQKSLDRRQKQNIAITEEDLPVNSSYVAQIKALGIKTYFTSNWWNGVLVQTDKSNIASINALPFVQRSELVAPGTKLLGGRQRRVSKNNESASTSEASEFQLQQLVLDKMQQEGYRGEGVNVAQFDSGWIGVNIATPFQHLFLESRVKAAFNFVKNTTDVYSDDNHGTEVLSVMGAYSPGIFTGGAYKANFFLFETEDKATEYRIEEYNWAFAAERADSLGVDVINSSLGYNTFDDSSMDYKYSDLNGSKAVVTITARKAVEKGMIVVCSVGNEGSQPWKYVTAPADAVGVVAVGSVTSISERSSFSSIGPSADGRIKPEVVALGSGTSVILPSGSVGAASGTSLSSPLVSCLAAGLVQAFPQTAPKQLYNAIVNSGSQASKPDNKLGYGIPSFASAKKYVNSFEEDVSIFPNPTAKIVNIFFKEPANKSISVVIYNLVGQRISDQSFSITWDSNPVQYDFSSVPNGIYLMEVKSNLGAVIRKIVKGD
jgi:serine protease AprX